MRSSIEYPLNTIYFYLTEGCNLACRHCWLAPKFDPRAERYPVLPLGLFKSAVEEAEPLGLSGVKLTGGEPLMHPQIMEILQFIRTKQLSLTIETNGIICTPNLAKEISLAHDKTVSVSLDGADAQTHEWVRGVNGSFDQALSGIRNLVHAGIYPQIIMTLMRANAHQVVEMIHLAEGLGASSVKFNIIQPTGCGELFQSREQGLDVVEYINLGRYVDLELSQITELDLIFDYPLAFQPLSRISEIGSVACGIKGIIGVLPNGYYALCGIGEHLPELVFGEVGGDHLAKFWFEHPLVKQLRTGLPGELEGICSQCLMKPQCLGCCVAQNYYRSQNLWSPFWFCERAFEEDCFPSTRML